MSPIPLSKTHPLVRRVRLLAQSPEERRRHGLMLAEGIHLAEDALAAGVRIVEAIAGPRLTRDGRGKRLLSELSRAGVPLHHAGDKLLDTLHDAESHQGILLVTALPVASLDEIERSTAGGTPLLIACGIQDPGNMGSLVRVADAAGASGLIAAGGADPFGPKAARASAGSIFRLPVARVPRVADLAPLAAGMRRRGMRLAGAVPRGGRDYREPPPSSPWGLVLGGETAGLPEEVERLLDERLSIPMREGVDSLNVAAAAAVLLFTATKRPGVTTPRAPSPPKASRGQALSEQTKRRSAPTSRREPSAPEEE